jgi:hypothetical protein
MLEEMWNAPSHKEQLKILRTLEDAASAMFKTAFPERIDALSIGLSATRILKGDVIGPLEKLHKWNQPKARVGAVSFANKVSSDLRKHLLNDRRILRRHFTVSELRELGSNP